MKNYNVIKVDKPIPDHEIDQYKNFEGLMRTYRKNLRIKWIIGAGLLVMVLLSGYYYLQMNSQQSGMEKSAQSLEESTTQPNLKNVQIDSTKNDLQIEDQVLVDRAEKDQSLSEVEKVQKPVQQPEKIGSQLAFAQAKPKKGFDHLYQYFNNNLQLPDSFAINGEKILVVAECFINATGDAEEIEITEGDYTVLNQEAIRLIQSMPPWEPAVIEGEKIRSKVTIPIYFKINQQ